MFIYLQSLETSNEKDKPVNLSSVEKLKRISRLEEARKSIATILSQSLDVLNDESLYERDFFNELYIPQALGITKNFEDQLMLSKKVITNFICILYTTS